MNTTRKQRLARAKFALPSSVTLLSIACGFASIVISVDNAQAGSPHDYRLAAILLVLAGVFDALDGFVARATNTSSEFGMQLDSIADVMNFGCSPADLSWKAGVDVLCFGGTKNGMAVGEAILFFNHDLAVDFDYRCKQAGQLASKMRFLSAPWVGLLENDAWLKHSHSPTIESRVPLPQADRPAPWGSSP